MSPPSQASLAMTDTWKHWPLCLQIIPQTSCLMFLHDSNQPVLGKYPHKQQMTLCTHPTRRHEMSRAYSASLTRVWRSPHSKVTIPPFVLDTHVAGKGLETTQNLSLSLSSHFQPWTSASRCNSCLQWQCLPSGEQTATALEMKVLMIQVDQRGVAAVLEEVSLENNTWWAAVGAPV